MEKIILFAHLNYACQSNHFLQKESTGLMAKITTREIKNQILFFTKPEKKAPRIIPKKIADHLRRPMSRTVHSFFLKRFMRLPLYIIHVLSKTNQRFTPLDNYCSPQRARSTRRKKDRAKIANSAEKNLTGDPQRII